MSTVEFMKLKTPATKNNILVQRFIFCIILMWLIYYSCSVTDVWLILFAMCEKYAILTY